MTARSAHNERLRMPQVGKKGWALSAALGIHLYLTQGPYEYAPVRPMTLIKAIFFDGKDMYVLLPNQEKPVRLLDYIASLGY